MSVAQVQLPPALTSSNVEVVVEGIIVAALRGIRVFVTAFVKDTLSDLFKKLGVELREYQGELPDTCVVIREQQNMKVVIEVYDSGRKINVVSTTLKRLAGILESYLKRKRGDVQQLYFEIIIPRDFAKLLEKTGGEEDKDEKQ